MAEPSKRPGKTDPNIRLLGQVLLAALLWGSTFAATHSDWLARAANLPARVALVATGVGGFLPMVFVYARAIRMQDEFSERLHLIALGIAFAIVGVLSYAVDMLHQAHFIEQPSSYGVWFVMLVVWWLAIVIIPRLYR
jgi:uncharacterized YccA/Bax inhibitor family protein